MLNTRDRLRAIITAAVFPSAAAQHDASDLKLPPRGTRAYDFKDDWDQIILRRGCK